MVNKVPPMVDMAITPQEQAEDSPKLAPVPVAGKAAVAKAPIYPWGLSISMCDRELEKAKLDPAELKVGDTIHLFAFAKVTSISSNDTPDGSTNRVEFQITHLADENEDAENQEAAAAPKVSKTKALYR
jgi:hypothetical protein